VENRRSRVGSMPAISLFHLFAASGMVRTPDGNDPKSADARREASPSRPAGYATGGVSRPALGETPTHPIHSTGTESGPLTTIHDLRIINSMVNDSAEQLTTVFLALADPTRRAILERLAHGEASGTELAQPFSISVPTISKHLRVLKNAELILHRTEAMRALVGAGWPSLLDALASVLSSPHLDF